MKLTPKQMRFVDEYMVDFNATQAAIRAGYKAKTAHVIGAENLRKPKIAEEIARRQKDLQRRTEVTQDRVVKHERRKPPRHPFQCLHETISDCQHERLAGVLSCIRRRNLSDDWNTE